MIDQNPFANFSVEDQNYIADQLRKVKSTMQLSTSDQSDVDKALSYLPMSKAQAESSMLNAATLGMGKWKSSGPTFSNAPPSMYLSPEQQEQERLGRQARPLQFPAPELQYVQPGYLKTPDQTTGSMQERIAKGAPLRARIRTEEGLGIGEVQQKQVAAGSALGADVSQTFAQLNQPFTPLSPEQKGVARGIGGFAGGMVADPTTYATFSLGGPAGRVATAAFATQGLVGSYESGKELYNIWDREDIPRDRKIELGTNVALNSLMAGLGAKHTVGSFFAAHPSIPVEDRAEMQQRIESEWQQMPNGQMMRRPVPNATHSDAVQNVAVQGGGGQTVNQFPSAGFFGARINRSTLPEAPPAARVPDRNVIRPLDAQAPEGRRDVSKQLGRNLVVGNTPSNQPGSQSAPISVAGRAVGGPDAPYVGRYNTPPSIPLAPDVDARAAAIKPDIDTMQQAQAEWKAANPDKAPDVSWLLRRAQELKTGKPDPTIQGTTRTDSKAPDWVTEQRGNWFTSDMNRAKGYGGKLSYVDVPENVAKATDTSLPGRPENVLPEVWSKKAQPHSADVPPPAEGTTRLFRGIPDDNPTASKTPLAEPPELTRARTLQAASEGFHFGESEPSALENIGLLGGEMRVELKKETARAVSGGAPKGPEATPSIDPEKAAARELASKLTPDRGGVYDLRSVSDPIRHEWINMNLRSRVEGNPANQAEAFNLAKDQVARTFGADAKWTLKPYWDIARSSNEPTSGVLRYGINYEFENGKIARHVAPDTAPAGESGVSRLSPAGAKTFADIQASESKFNERTGGKHNQVLHDLWTEVNKALPPDTPIEGKQALYKKGLDAIHDALTNGKNVNDLYKAMDIVKKRGEGGFLGGSSRRLSPEEADRLTRLHVDTTLSKWEKRGVALSVLTKPTFKNAVYGANDPALELRYENLLKNGGESTDPIRMLANVVSGVSNKMLSRDILSENLSRAHFSSEQRQAELQDYVKDWKNRSIDDTLLFYDAVEHGDIQSLPDKKDRAVAGMLRTMLDQKRDQIRDLGTGKLDHFIENYLGRMWKQGPREFIQQAAQRRPFAGPASFLKPRVYEYFSDGIAAGKEPVTYNPVEMQIMKLHEMDRYLAAHQWFNETKAYGLVREFEDRLAPDGWTKLNDNMFRAGEGKNWYAPADVASAVNNHLSPGLRSGATGLLYNPIAHYSNLMNQFNLSASVFHGMETAYYSFAGEFGGIMQKILNGDIQGLGQVAGRWAAVHKGGPVAPLRQFLLGSKLLQESLHPGTFADLSDDVENLQKAGARLKMPSEFRNQSREGLNNALLELRHNGFKILGDGFTDTVMNNVGMRAIRVGTRFIGATLEQMARLLMEVWVPRIKLGAQAEAARDYLARNQDASPEQLRRGVRKIWDSMDDRFGEFTYDNMFMNRTVKDALHLGVRSFGWNFGTARTFVGAGLNDVFNLRDPQSLAGQIANKKYTGITERQAFTLGLLTTTYLTAAMLSHFMGQETDEYTKYGFAKTGGVNPDGSPARIYIKSYVTDAYGFVHAPGQTTLNKLAPVWHQVGELYQNSDYWGNHIHPIHPTTADAITDPETYTSLAKYQAQSMQPFSVTNYQQRRARGESVLSSLSSGSAILPAQTWVGQTKAESLAFDLFRTKLPRGPNDPAVNERTRAYHQMAAGFAAGTVKEADVEKALNEGVINEKQYDGILAADDTGKKDGDLDTLNRHVKYLDPNEFIHVFDYANPREKASMEERFYEKWDKAVNDGDTDTSKRFEEREHFLKQPAKQ